MAEERDPKVSQHYRGLEALEPPAELDRTIVAASRRVAAPRGRQRWYYSLAAAAVLVLAVALTWHVERERPDAAGPPQAAAPQLRLERELRGIIKPAETESQQTVPPESKPAEEKQRITREAGPRPGFAPDPRASAADALGAAPAPAAEAPAVAARRADETRRRADNLQNPPAKTQAQPEMQLRREETLARQQAPAPAATTMLAPPATPENPERWLERIAELRSRGKHAEADKELADFRRVYPSYPLSELMRERVEGR